MSYFSTALKAALENEGLSQAELSRRTGIKTGQLSKYVNGANEPAMGTLEGLCAAFPASARALLAAAHLRDRTPACAKSLVEIGVRPRTGRLAEEPREFSDLPRDVREALKFLQQESKRSEEIRDVIVALVAALRA